MLDFELPYLLRVLGSLTAILVLNKLTERLTISMMVGTVILALSCGHEPAAMLHIAVSHAISSSNIFLMIVVMQVIWLSSQMSRTDSMKALVETVKGILPVRAAMAVLPAIIGLLPMPGGAIFSAPLVDDCDDERLLAPMLKTLINYWFRHLWEYWWPLYPGVILAIQMTGLSELAFIGLQLPLSLFSAFAGYLFYLRQVPSRPLGKRAGGYWRKLLMLTSPILVLIGVFTLLKLVTQLLQDGPSTLPPLIAEIVNAKYMPMVLGILVAQVYLQWMRPLPKRDWIKIVWSPQTGSLALLVFIVTIYSAFVQAHLPDGGLLMTEVREELLRWGIPLALVIMVIPFVAGLSTGISVGMVGASFPVVLGLMVQNAPTGEMLSTVMLAYALGYMGMILSPVHICLIVSNQHFKTSLPKSLYQLVKPALIVIAGAGAFFFLIRALMVV